MAQKLHPLKIDDIEVGKPLPWPVYNKHKHLLLRAGYQIESQAQLEALMKEGLYHYGDDQPAISITIEESSDAEKSDSADEKLKEVPFLSAGSWVGETLQMQSLGEITSRYYVKCIGYFEKQSILISAPVVDGKIPLIKEGTPFKFRAFFGKNISHFNATVLRSCFAPYAYMHLSYPTFVQVREIRKAQRVKVDLIASVKTLPEKEGVGVATRIVDLSEFGALIQSNSNVWHPGDRIKLIFRLDTDEYMMPEAIVRNVTPKKDDTNKEVYNFGLEFDNLERRDSVYLRSYIFETISS
jgi:c-di-GMP-binding flagellar brake protein YcgR